MRLRGSFWQDTEAEKRTELTFTALNVIKNADVMTGTDRIRRRF